MNCRRCNTPIPSRSSSCPNCGQHAGSGESFIDDPGESGVQSAAPGEELMQPSLLSEKEDGDVEVDLDMDIDVEVEVDDDEEELSLDDAVVSPAPKRTDARRKAASKPARKVAKAKPSASKKAASSVAGVRSKRSAPPAELPPTTAVLPDPGTVRAILAQQPELIEPGLEVLTDDNGQEIGVQHATDVGVIDLLARDESGALVAVMVADPEAGADVVGESLHRLGWIRKHLAKNGEDVRGVVLTERLDEDAAYAAAAVSGTLRFKSYALSLSLSDLDV